MTTPFLRVEESGEVLELAKDVTTVGRGDGVDVKLNDPSVSRFHAELIRRGPYVYLADMGLSTNGTRVNGRPVGRRVLRNGDVVSFGIARARVGGIDAEQDDLDVTIESRRATAPDLTRRELEVLSSLCRPALQQEAFVAPATAREIADELVVTEAAVKQHLLRLYQKFRIPEGINRRARLANEVIAAGVVRPVPSPPAATGQAAPSLPSAASPAPPRAGAAPGGRPAASNTQGVRPAGSAGQGVRRVS
ncbi:MAG: FHA domain-containing protein [Mycobacteriales bacterium]